MIYFTSPDIPLLIKCLITLQSIIYVDARKTIDKTKSVWLCFVMHRQHLISNWEDRKNILKHDQPLHTKKNAYCTNVLSVVDNLTNERKILIK